MRCIDIFPRHEDTEFPFKDESGVPIVRVGGSGSDIEGHTNFHIQAAIEWVEALGGGIVELSDGVFHMEDSLHLRSNVLLRGRGDETTLRKAPMKKSRLTAFLGYGHCDLNVADPDLFHPGEGVLVSSNITGGFLDTVGTLTRRQGGTWFINRPANMDCPNSHGGIVRTLFPLVEATDVENVAVEKMVLDGNAAQNETINGCRGAAFYAYRSSNVMVRGVRAVNFAGDGFSFQTSRDVSIESCVTESCTGNGFHPGSGSFRPVIRNCRTVGCGESGLFYCLRVRHALIENCVFEANAGHGVMIWARDDDNINRRLVIRNNGGCGIFFMATPQGEESNCQTFEECELGNNSSKGGEAEILLQGGGKNIRLLRNKIVRRPGVPGIVQKSAMPNLEMDGNEISPSGVDAVVLKRG